MQSFVTIRNICV